MRKIVECKIEEYGYTMRVLVRFDKKEEWVMLFSYYADELIFRPDEFIGLTKKEALDLHHKKDVNYLIS